MLCSIYFVCCNIKSYYLQVVWMREEIVCCIWLEQRDSGVKSKKTCPGKCLKHISRASKIFIGRNFIFFLFLLR